MLQIINCSMSDFLKDIKTKKLVVFGAGIRTRHLYDACNLTHQIELIVDNDEKKRGTLFQCGDEQIPVVNVNGFANYISTNGIENTVLLITPLNFSYPIIEQLDKISMFDGLRTYIANLINDYYEEQDIVFSEGSIRIPKKIHYCWFGGNKIPEHLQKNIDGWKKICPDYEIIEWNERNYDVTKNRYMREAYENKKWGFVPDYARLDIIYNEGGIYFDTDVELLSSPDRLLHDRAFMGFCAYADVNLGVGFGAEKDHELIRAMRDYYDDKSFYTQDGSLDMSTCCWHQQSVLKEYGVKFNNTFQKKEDFVLYPTEVFAPDGVTEITPHYTENTISAHRSELSWNTQEARTELRRLRHNIVERIAQQEKWL